ncbi:MAG: hypothetical protein H6737_32145 [Alphaproteobacteria bacterium]|nr:hypothetical protein [Alphaproteobacteria bacterium]
MSHLSPDDFLHASPRDAIQALQRIGADHEPRFDMEVDSPEMGRLKRFFGVLGNVVDKQAYVEEPSIVNRLITMLQDPDNDRIYQRLQSSKLKYTPINKRTARLIASDLAANGVHLPWTWRPMNFDFAAVASKVHRQSPLPFIIFYSQQAMFSSGGVSLGRIFSLPVEGTAQGTWAEPISDEMLDPDVGLVIEANCRA